MWVSLYFNGQVQSQFSRALWVHEHLSVNQWHSLSVVMFITSHILDHLLGYYLCFDT